MADQAVSARVLDPATGECFISIVVVSWNTRELLRECISSALSACAELGRPAELIVVDNDSSDASPEMVRTEFPTVRVFANASNIGFAAATNQGIRESRGRFILLLNPDTKATPRFLNVLVGFAEGRPDAGAVGPRIVGPDGEHQVSCFRLPTLGRELWRLLLLDRLYEYAAYPPRLWRATHPQAVDIILGACMLIRREALEQAGLLDERFFMYTEEVDLCRRLLDRAWRVVWVPEAVIVHYGAASTRQVANRMFLELYRSKVLYFRKHLGVVGSVAYKVVLLAATLPRLVLPAIALAVVPSSREKSRVLLKNYSSLLVRLPAF